MSNLRFLQKVQVRIRAPLQRCRKADDQTSLYGLDFASCAGSSQRARNVAAAAPASCAATKPGTSTGRIPANVSLAARAAVTAGFANEVDAVNQYAAVMEVPTAHGTAEGCAREHPR